jgi:hypothetical protein
VGNARIPSELHADAWTACATVIFLFAGSLTIPSVWLALLPAALYSAIQMAKFIEDDEVKAG